MPKKAKKPEVYLISGTMGSGKDAVLKRLKDRFDFYWVTSTTTRAIRPKEKEGRPYYFVSKKDFNQMIKRNRFIEYGKIYDDFYGITREEIRNAFKNSKKIFLRVDENGIKRLKKIFPQAIGIFIAPPSMNEIKRRIIGRGSTPKNIIKERLKAARRQMKKLIQCDCDYIIINSDIRKTVKRVYKIVK